MMRALQRNEADFNDHGLLAPAQAGLLVDQYELAMAASYLRHGMNEPAIFELFVRRLPPRRHWLLVAGLGPVLRMIEQLRFDAGELAYLEGLGFPDVLLGHLADFRFSGDIDAMPEGTIAFADEPLVRVRAPLVDAQLLETLLLNQVNFQTLIATKAARIALAAGGGEVGAAHRVVNFSPRRDHGTDAAMKAARSAAIAGSSGTSNVAAAMRYGLTPVGTMAHSYIESFDDEETAFATFLEDFPGRSVLLVDTYDTLTGVRRAIDAARRTGVALRGVRLDSGDLLALARATRALLDEAGLTAAQIVASGNLEEHRIAELVAAGAPIDQWGVGTDLGTSRDSPTVDGVYKLVSRARGGEWRDVWKRSPDKETVPGAKQVFRRRTETEMLGDTIARADTPQGAGERCAGEPLLVAAMRGGEMCLSETLPEVRSRAERELAALPRRLRADPPPGAADPEPYPVEYSPGLRGPFPD